MVVSKKKGHTCGDCGQSFDKYEDESNEKRMLRNCDECDGSETDICASCSVVLLWRIEHE
jgi:hypothetical protein